MNNTNKHPFDQYISHRLSTIASAQSSFISYYCQSVRLQSDFAEKMKTTKYQLLISITVGRHNERMDSYFNSLLGQLEFYKSKAQNEQSLTPITLMEKVITYNHFLLDILIPLPECQSVKEYYYLSKISMKEFQYHLYQAYDIRTFLGHLRCKGEEVLKKNYSLGLFFEAGCPFPRLRLTPLMIINRFLSCEQPEFCKKEEKCTLTSQLNSYSVKMNSNLTEFTRGYNNNCSFSNKCDYGKNKNQNNNQNAIYYGKLEQIILGNELNERMIQMITTIKNTWDNCYLRDFEAWASGEILGNGAYGTVQKAFDSYKRPIAIKSARGETFVNLKNEAIILSLCDHPNIVKFFGFKQTNTARYSSGQMYMEMCQCNLEKYIERRRACMSPLTQEEIKSIFNQMVSASEYLYEHFGIVHRDIKLENYLVNEDENGIVIKMCDLGFACKASEKMIEFVGSPRFCAPEVLGNSPYSYKADLFSLGICLYFMLNGRFPFAATNTNQLKKAYEAHSSFVFRDDIQCELVNLCQKCLEYNAENRITIEELSNYTSLAF